MINNRQNAAEAVARGKREALAQARLDAATSTSVVPTLAVLWRGHSRSKVARSGGFAKNTENS